MMVDFVYIFIFLYAFVRAHSPKTLQLHRVYVCKEKFVGSCWLVWHRCWRNKVVRLDMKTGDGRFCITLPVTSNSKCHISISLVLISTNDFYKFTCKKNRFRYSFYPNSVDCSNDLIPGMRRIDTQAKIFKCNCLWA